MIRGKAIFLCPKCGRIFISFDIEDMASAESAPQPCPDCGTPSRRARISDLIFLPFKKIR